MALMIIVGGFAYSATETKSGNNYIAGGSTNTCDGNGIYFLTDGARTRPKIRWHRPSYE
jgi:type IV pilus assembly protein PilY1